MRFVTFRTLLVAMALLALCLLGGCSGAGLAPQALRNDSLQTLAADQMTMLVLLKGWLQVLYSPAVPPGIPTVDNESTGTGYTHVFGTDGWGKPFDYYVSDADGSGYGTTYFNGHTVKATWDAPQGSPVGVQHIRFEYDEMTLEYTASTDSGAPQAYAPYSWDGTETLKGGRALHFRFESNSLDTDRLLLELPQANLEIQAEVPVRYVSLPDGSEALRPVSDSRVTGTAAAPSGDLTFTIKGTDGAWQELDLVASAIGGSFSLGVGMAGSGEFRQGGQLLAALNWPDTLVARLDRTTMATVEVTPPAAARDLSVDRWIWGVANLSPGSVQ